MGFYQSDELLQRVDVGLVWRPARPGATPHEVEHRPATRLAWWWSHNLPVIGSPLTSILELATTHAYPVTPWLNLRTPSDVGRALCALRRAATRKCLQSAARLGSARTSPHVSATEWRAALCEMLSSRTAGQPQQPWTPLLATGLRLVRRSGLAKVLGGPPYF